MSVPTVPSVPSIPQDPTFDPAGEEEFFDSYAFDQTFKWYLPDGKQYIEFRQMNEGDKLAYEKATNRDLSVDRKTDTARFKIDQGGDRHLLIKQVVSGWFLKMRNKDRTGWDTVGSNPANLDAWLKVTGPKLVQNLYDEIVRRNPGVLTDDATAEEIKQQIEELQELLVQKEREASGKS